MLRVLYVFIPLFNRETKFSESVARLQKMNINMSFEEENLPESFLTGREPLPEIGEQILILDSDDV